MEMAPVAPKRIRHHMIATIWSAEIHFRFRMVRQISKLRRDATTDVGSSAIEDRLPNDFFRIENRALGAGSLVIPLAIRLLDLGDTGKANPDSTGHRGFER